MVETKTGHDRTAGVTYLEVIKADTVPPPPVYLEESPYPGGVTKVATHRYYTREEHDREVERLWKRVWQMACHEDDIPNVGDTYVYEIAGLSFILVRNAPGDGPGAVKAFPNACLHRGRQLCDAHRQGLKVLRCPFHGWSWHLDGKLKEVPSHWDFPSVTEEEYSLPPVSVGHWGGFVFINPDPDAEPLEHFLGDIDRHFSRPFTKRYKAAHMVKRLPCNWKVAQEAFMESYHVVGTHPELLPMFLDTGSKYDVWPNISRAMSASGPPSAHTDLDAPDPSAFPEGQAFTSFRHPLNGHLYSRIAENRVEVRHPNGKTGVFDMTGAHVEGEVVNADAHMCNWIGGKIAPGEENMPTRFASASTEDFRADAARDRRELMRPQWGDAIDKVSDADMIDAIFYSVFPNLHPWADFNPIFYRFRPDGNNPEQSLHEVMYMLPVPDGEERPAPAKCTLLDLEDDYTKATEFGSYLNKIFNQDGLNHAAVQKGLHNHPKGEVIFASYQESKIRDFHNKLNLWLDSETPPKSR